MDGGQPEGRPRGVGVTTRLLVALVLIVLVGYVGYLAIALGPDVDAIRLADVLRGEHRTLEPARRRGAPLRTAAGGNDRVYLLTTQGERIVPLRLRLRGTARPPRELLHVDLWAFDSATARPVWRTRLRTYEDGGTLMFELLGVDGGMLWALVGEPIGVAVSDGAMVGDGARIDAANPAMAGKRVDRLGYVAFGGQGLQLTLSDSTQWVVDGASLAARPRAVAPAPRGDIAMPAYEGSATASFQMRGLPLEGRWLGVLTDAEANILQAPAVVPGAKPGERRGAAADFYERQHVPGDLTAQPRPYRLWRAKVSTVSAAPHGWPRELPDNWGTRDVFSEYAPLPDAPAYLQAGLLGDGRSPLPLWLRDPDSIVVLSLEKVGGGGRLHLARVSGPSGRAVWDATLPLDLLSAVMFGPRALVLVGTAANPAYDSRARDSWETDDHVVVVNLATGGCAGYNLSAESVRETDPASTVKAASTP